MCKNLLRFIFLLSFISFLTACKKDEDETGSQQPKPQTPLELQANAQVIDTSKMVLNLTESDLGSGKYVFSSIGEPQLLKPGDVMIGSANKGYIRKITSVSESSGNVTYETEQGTFEDVFKKGDLNLNLDMNDMVSGGRLEGFSYSLSNKALYTNGPLSVTLASANLSMNPKWNLDFKFGENGIEYFEMATSGSSWQADAKLQVSASKAVELVNQTDTLGSYSKTFVKWVQVGFIPVPIVVELEVHWVAEFSADLEANISTFANASANGNLSLGVKYSNKQWEGIYDFDPKTNLVWDNLSGNATMGIKYSQRPVINARINGVLGPRASVGLLTEATGSVASPSLDWDLEANAWLQATIGADVTILGKQITNFPDKVWESQKLTFKQPYEIQKISGDNQFGKVSSTLSEPCRVRVLDNLGMGVENVPVYFKVKSGEGTVDPQSIMTDKDGYAQASWTLGSDELFPQELEASARTGKLEEIGSSPLVFIAIIDTSECEPPVLNAARNGKTITATATGGKMPYQYEFLNWNASKNMSPSNTFDLVYDGKYQVIVKDARGCRDTIDGCLKDVTISTFQTTADDSMGVSSGLLTLTYSSSLGLIPQFLIHDKSSGNYSFQNFLVTGGNNGLYPSKLNDYCSGGSWESAGPAFKSASGNAFSNTVKFTFPSANQPTGAVTLKLRLPDCYGGNLCGGNSQPNILFGQEYTLSW